MSYTLYKTNGNVLTTISDGNLDVTTTSLSLPGPGYLGYGQALNENLIYLLENFASSTSPLVGKSLPGQLWFDTGTQKLNVFTSNGYATVSGVTVSGTQPLKSITGDIWYSSITGQSKLYDGTTWNLMGPQYTKAQGVSGAIPEAVGDATIVGNTHNIIKLQYGTQLIATVNGDDTFIPDPPINGFPIIQSGITFNNLIASPSITANLVGSVTGSVVGNLTGNVAGNLVGNVIATTLVGTLTGNVIATTLVGTLTGNTSSQFSQATNFSSGNAVITGGSLTGLNVVSTTNAQATNFSSGNAVITGGSATALATVAATVATFANSTQTNLTTTNLFATNVAITGGYITNLTRTNIGTGYIANFSSPNVLITGGSITGTVINSGISNTGNFSTGNAQISGGSVLNLDNLSATTGFITYLTSANAQIAGGNIVATPIWNATITAANLVSVTASTPVTSDKTKKLATTEFVHNVMPAGMIVMWGGSSGSIPDGWNLCDGSNGTPDLRNRFVIGATGTYPINTTGGNASVTLTANMMPVHSHSVSLSGTSGASGSHSHSAAVADPGHSHRIYQSHESGGSHDNAVYPQTDGSGPFYYNTQPIESATTGIAVTISTAAAHTHSVSVSGSTGNAGSTTAVDIRPPYYALCYIQKIY